MHSFHFFIFGKNADIFTRELIIFSPEYRFAKQMHNRVSTCVHERIANALHIVAIETHVVISARHIVN